MPVFDLVRRLGPALAGILVACALLVAPVSAQTSGQSSGQTSGMSQSGTGSDPTAQSVNEEQLLQELRKIEGRVTIPDGKAALLEQPQGRGYRQFHEGALPWIATIVILGALALLAVLYFSKGRIRMEEGTETGVKIKRFNVVERLNHWMTATAFIVLAITGLNYFFGKRLLMPVIGADAFSTWSFWAKYAHNFVAWAFMLGILVMIALWIKDNIPDRYDLAWLRAGGGFFSGRHVPAARFNAGQKLIFWTVVLGGLALSASGIVMLFPFSLADINGMQWAQYVHATTGVVMIAIILGHIYIGSLGMEGAYDAMGSGEVDLGWARAHHSVWVEKEQAKNASGPQLSPGAASTPAE
ncbi:MAG: formate dehydrogenase subunit gamma [Rhizobiales bacterium]|nr:formate dehydrogenase subunit gamma [Hyphomicrobiales bacterium]